MTESKTVEPKQGWFSAPKTPAPQPKEPTFSGFVASEAGKAANYVGDGIKSVGDELDKGVKYVGKGIDKAAKGIDKAAKGVSGYVSGRAKEFSDYVNDSAESMGKEFDKWWNENETVQKARKFAGHVSTGLILAGGAAEIGLVTALAVKYHEQILDGLNTAYNFAVDDVIQPGIDMGESAYNTVVDNVINPMADTFSSDAFQDDLIIVAEVAAAVVGFALLMALFACIKGRWDEYKQEIEANNKRTVGTELTDLSGDNDKKEEKGDSKEKEVEKEISSPKEKKTEEIAKEKEKEIDSPKEEKIEEKVKEKEKEISSPKEKKKDDLFGDEDEALFGKEKEKEISPPKEEKGKKNDLFGGEDELFGEKADKRIDELFGAELPSDKSAKKDKENVKKASEVVDPEADKGHVASRGPS